MGTTNYLDPANRSLLTEVKVLNTPRPDGSYTLLPGHVRHGEFVVNREKPPLVIPAPALVTNADGTQVAVVQNGTVHFQKVKLGEDYGSEVEVVSGLTPEERSSPPPASASWRAPPSAWTRRRRRRRRHRGKSGSANGAGAGDEGSFGGVDEARGGARIAASPEVSLPPPLP